MEKDMNKTPSQEHCCEQMIKKDKLTDTGIRGNILRGGLFLLILAGFLASFSLLMRPKNNREDFGMGEMKANGILAEQADSIDVVFVGDSECALAFAPLVMEEEAGISAYNCGTAGQYLYESYMYLLQAMKRQNPRVVILETNTIYRECELKNYLFSKVERLIPVFRYHDRWKDMRPEDLGPVEYTWRDEHRGHMYYTESDPALNTEYMIPDDAVRGVARWNRQSLREIQALCEKRGAQLILISAPSTVNWNYANHNGIAALAQEMGVPYIDMNLMREEIPIDWNTDTKDAGDHVNAFGAEKVSRWLARFLRKEYLQ